MVDQRGNGSNYTVIVNNGSIAITLLHFLYQNFMQATPVVRESSQPNLRNSGQNSSVKSEEPALRSSLQNSPVRVEEAPIIVNVDNSPSQMYNFLERI